jgi:dihydrofolate reductase
MGRVIASASMSLDGFIAKQDNSIGHLFDWFSNGDLEFPTASPGITFHLNQRSFDYWSEWVSTIGALICGRTLFDFTDGWNGRHTMDVPVIVVTHQVPADWIAAHPGAPFTFVTTGVQDAVEHAQAIARERHVAVTAGTIAGQCLELGLLDEVATDLVPVVMGAGKPFFSALSTGDAMLGDPTACVPSERVTHLRFPVRRCTGD